MSIDSANWSFVILAIDTDRWDELEADHGHHRLELDKIKVTTDA